MQHLISQLLLTKKALKHSPPLKRYFALILSYSNSGNSIINLMTNHNNMRREIKSLDLLFRTESTTSNMPVNLIDLFSNFYIFYSHWSYILLLLMLSRVFEKGQRFVFRESFNFHGHGHGICAPLGTVITTTEIDVHFLGVLCCKVVIGIISPCGRNLTA
jgi:hypothetical protein